MILLKQTTYLLLVLSFALTVESFAQNEQKEVKKINFGYSANPPAKTSKKINKKNSESQTARTNPNRTQTVDAGQNTESAKDQYEMVSVAEKTRNVVKKSNIANLSSTEIYKVGVGDVLFINLQNSTAKYYTVLIDGTIDYPLAGKLVSVINLTTDEIEELLREKIKLYDNPQITVKVREYASHQIKIEGLAKTGDHYLQREAIPLVVVKTMVDVKPEATEVVIERENTESVTLALNDSESDDFLIMHGDKLKFQGADFSDTTGTNSGFYFVGEKICSGGKKNFHNGITLVQAVFEACGGMNDKIKVLTIIRKTKNGSFIAQKFSLKDIYKGKEVDPVLQPGDMIDLYK